MAKKKPHHGRHEERHDETKPRAAPTFRPLEGALKKLAEEKRAAEKAEAEKQRAAAAAKAAAGKSKQAPRPVVRPSAPAQPTRPSSLTPEERRELDSMGRDDEFFFQRLMSGVVPLSPGKQRITTAAEVKAKPRDVATAEARAQKADDEVRDHLMTLVEGAARFEVSDDGKRLEGRRLDLGTSTWRRLRMGDLPIDARLDLHGMNADGAREALEVFLREKRVRRDRVVLVIHGRGEHSPAGLGVLRGEIAAWLSQGRASQHVAAFATARQDDGGEGALYVLLRP
jgi:DNA-nicking Smr family endonuclease